MRKTILFPIRISCNYYVTFKAKKDVETVENYKFLTKM